MSGNPIRAKVKALPPAALEEMAAAAEAALEELRGDYLTEARALLEKLRRLLVQPQDRPAGWHAEARRLAHDLKAEGTTFDYALVTRIAQSLCEHFTSEPPDAARDKRALAHCEALRLVLDKDIRGDGGEYGHRLLGILSIEH